MEFWEHKMFHSLPSFFKGGSHTPQDNPLPDLFPAIPLTSAESVNPTSAKSPLADPTYDESPLSAPAASPINTTAPEPRHSHRVSTFSTHLRAFHCFSTFATLHEPHTFHEASSNSL